MNDQVRERLSDSNRFRFDRANQATVIILDLTQKWIFRLGNELLQNVSFPGTSVI